MESTDLVPMDNDKPRIQRRAEEFRDLPESLQRNLQTFLTLTMDTLAALHQKVKSSMIPDATKQRVSIEVVPLLYSSDSSHTTRHSIRYGQSQGPSWCSRAFSSIECLPMCIPI